MPKESIMKKVGFWAVMIGVCVLAAAGGCVKQEKLALKFNPGDTGTYKVTIESIKDYKFEQPSINQTKEQQTLNSVEIVYNQKIQSVDPAGDAKALITIEGLKYLSKSPKGTAIDFDSSKEADQKNALENLIGQSYVIKISPAGQVVGVEDVRKALDAVKGDTLEQKTAQSLLADDAIKQRHSIVALPEKKNEFEKVGRTWSKVQAGPAGMLTPRSYEKVYTLQKVEGEKGQQVAVVTMEARPSATRPASMSSEESKGMGFFEKMFDNKETYTGQMLMDVTTGKVKSYNEKLKSEWVAVEPAEEQKSDKGPDVLTMGFTYVYDIEKVK
jgi:hypothetical protein